MAKKLTPKQALFIKEYLVDLNATRAAIRAGYADKAAHAMGWQNLTIPEIKAAVTKAQKERAERLEVTADWVVQELIRVYKRCMQEEPVYWKGSDQPIEFRFEHAGANRALELIGRHLGMFTDKFDIGDNLQKVLSDKPITQEEWLKEYGKQPEKHKTH